jgi:cytochrome c oxidase assembly factor CtaG
LQHTRARELPRWRAVCFLGGLLALWIALASPIDALDDFLLSAHMLQHFILMSVAPPLLVLGAPLVPMLRGLPRWMVRGLRPVFASRTVHKVAHALAHPAVAWLVMNVAYLGWHVPQAFELTLRSEAWHNTEHMCFLFTSIAFWWVIVEPWPSRTRWSRWMVIPYLLTADVVNTILSAVLAFSGKVLYPSYAAAERISRLTPLKDQVLAGSEMWVLNSLVFLVPVAVIVVRMLSPRGLRDGSGMKTDYARL